MEGRHRLAPQARRLENIRLVHACHLRRTRRSASLTALSRRLKRDAGDADDFAFGVRRDVVCSLPAIRASFLAEVRTAGEFPHDQEIDALRDDFVLERTRPLEHIPYLRGAQVGEKPQFATKRE